MSKILVVEDDATLREMLLYNLQREGYNVLTAADGIAALELARQEQPDLLILDLMLPRMDGLTLTRILRKETDIPILMVTAKADEVDTIVGLEVGADDYITKPFRIRELLARIHAALRRVERIQRSTGGGTSSNNGASAATPPSLDQPERIQTASPLILAGGDLQVDIARREVRRGNALVNLKPREFDLLAFLAVNHGTVLSREVLLERVWGYDFTGDTRTVDVHIRWLREKLEDDPSHPLIIETVRGSGYRLRD